MRAEVLKSARGSAALLLPLCLLLIRLQRYGALLLLRLVLVDGRVVVNAADLHAVAVFAEVDHVVEQALVRLLLRLLEPRGEALVRYLWLRKTLGLVLVLRVVRQQRLRAEVRDIKLQSAKERQILALDRSSSAYVSHCGKREQARGWNSLSALAPARVQGRPTGHEQMVRPHLRISRLP